MYFPKMRSILWSQSTRSEQKVIRDVTNLFVLALPMGSHTVDLTLSAGVRQYSMPLAQNVLSTKITKTQTMAYTAQYKIIDVSVHQ